MRRVAILGAGTIGESLLRGLLSGGWREPSELVVTVRDEERAAELAERYGVEATTSNAEAVAGAALVVIAVKPQDFDVLLGEIGGLLTPEQTVLSVAAAIPTSAIESRIARRRAGRARDAERARDRARGHRRHLRGRARRRRAPRAGRGGAVATSAAVVRVPERYMDAVTAVSGSGPAYFALLAEAMIEAGILLGLSREVSTQLVVQTMLGTAKLLRDEEHAPGRAARAGHLAGRDDDPRDPRARARRRARRVPERDPGRDGALARARRRRAVTLTASSSIRRRRRRGGGARSSPSELGDGRARRAGDRAHRRHDARPRVRARGRAGTRLEPRSSCGGATSAACRPRTSARTTGSPASALLDRLSMQPRAVHRIRGELGAETAARGVRRGARGRRGSISSCSGLGADGHAASLFPNRPTLDERDRRAVPAEAGLEPFVDRVTLTVPVLCAAPEVLFLVTGESKAEAVERAFGRPPDPTRPRA